MKTQNTINTEDKVLRFIDGALTKFTIYAVIGSLLALVIYNGVLLNGFSSVSWGL